jgi:hypothetical protein
MELDRDERKLEVFLSFHRATLTAADLKVFLPFTINLDPYIKKVIKQHYKLLLTVKLFLIKSALYVEVVKDENQVEGFDSFVQPNVVIVNSTSNYTFWAFYRSYFKGIRAITNCKCIA